MVNHILFLTNSFNHSLYCWYLKHDNKSHYFNHSRYDDVQFFILLIVLFIPNLGFENSEILLCQNQLFPSYHMDKSYFTFVSINLKNHSSPIRMILSFIKVSCDYLNGSASECVLPLSSLHISPNLKYSIPTINILFITCHLLLSI